jgi:L-lactate dehydrogenase complex protein LldG
VVKPGAARTDARTSILGRIRDALGPRANREAEYAAIPREYRRHPSLPRAEVLALFVERLEHYQVGVRRAPRAQVQEAIGQAAAARGRSSLVIAPGVPRDWLPAALRTTADDGLDAAALDRAEGVLTGCSFGIASTGTIVLRHTAAEGRRALTLVPDYHLCVVFEEQVVQTVPEALGPLAGERPRLVTTISGPSATADIEMTRIKGVHGPRTLDVILLS